MCMTGCTWLVHKLHVCVKIFVGLNFMAPFLVTKITNFSTPRKLSAIRCMLSLVYAVMCTTHCTVVSPVFSGHKHDGSRGIEQAGPLGHRLEIGTRHIQVSLRFVGQRPHNDCRPVLVPLHQLRHYLQMMLKSLVHKVVLSGGWVHTCGFLCISKGGRKERGEEGRGERAWEEEERERRERGRGKGGRRIVSKLKSCTVMLLHAC